MKQILNTQNETLEVSQRAVALKKKNKQKKKYAHYFFRSQSNDNEL